MAITLKEESILNAWIMMIDHGSGNAGTILATIQVRLKEARIPGECDWEVAEVESSGFFAKVRRDFLIVNLLEFSDYHMHIGIRDYGVHLDCC